MADTRPLSPIQQARRNIEKAKREQARRMASLRLSPGSDKIGEEEAKRIAAALTEILRR